MASYIQQSLEKGEKIIYKGSMHWSVIIKYILFALLFVLAGLCLVCMAYMSDSMQDHRTALLLTACVLMLLGVCIYAVGWFVQHKSEFAITNSRFIQKMGILNIKLTEIPLFKVETVNFYQELWERMFNTGAIELVGSGGTCHRMEHISRPMDVRKRLLQAISEASAANSREEQPAAE